MYCLYKDIIAKVCIGDKKYYIKNYILLCSPHTEILSKSKIEAK